MRFRHVAVFVGVMLAAASGCTQDFDVFVATDGAADGAQGSDAADAADTGSNDSALVCDAPASCLTSANACGQSCISSYNQCAAGCGGSQACRSLCKSQEQTCEMTCVTICEGCFDGGCAAQSCQGAIP